MELNLDEKEVRVYSRYVKGTLQQAESRPDLQWLCGVVKNNGQDAKKIIMEELEIEEFRAGALIVALEKQGMIVDGSLSAEGERCYIDRIAFFPEEGAYKIWYPEADHFAFEERRVLHWDYADQNLHEITRYDESVPKIESVLSMEKNAKNFHITAMAKEELLAGNLKINIIWRSNEKDEKLEISCSGQINVNEYRNVKFYLTIPKRVDLLETIISWSLKNGYEFDRSTFSLMVKFDNLTDKERKTFERLSQDLGEIAIETRKLTGKLTNLPILPINREEGAKWFYWSILNGIDNYIMESDLEDRIEGLKALHAFAKYSYSIELTKLKEALKKSDRKKYWYMVAGNDLLALSEKKRGMVSHGCQLTYEAAFLILFPDINFKNALAIEYVDMHAFEILRWKDAPKGSIVAEEISKLGFNGKYIFVSKDIAKPSPSSIGNNVIIKGFGEVGFGDHTPHSRYLIVRTGTGTTFYELTHNLFHPRSRRDGGLDWADVAAVRLELAEVRNDPTRNKLLNVLESVSP